MILKWIFRIAGGILFCCGVCLVGFFAFWVWAMTGQIRGTEISPDGFQVRQFSYHKPVFARQGFWLDTSINSNFSAELAGLGVVPIRPPITWHLSRDNVTTIRSVDRHSEILLNLISTYDNNGFVWIEWSKKHPEQAAKLWPIVQSMAFDQLYLTMPVLFLVAQENQSLPPEPFEVKLRESIEEDLQAMIEEAEYQNNSIKAASWQTLLDKYSPAAGAIPPPAELNPNESDDLGGSSDTAADEDFGPEDDG